ncbi:hypothetical protein [Arthrobacter alpinus]|uniref:hypothetical protein n=1 Tax=Arthrobacter alpinus TaxID=656366 RepID=UPI000A66B2B9|nr:hypothetical protein [Arthrobacter alpinus]
MSASNPSGSQDEFNPPEEQTRPDSFRHPANITNQTGPLGTASIAAVGIAITAGILIQDPRLRQVCRSVVQDPKVHQAIKEANEAVFREISASWRRHGGIAILASVFHAGVAVPRN